MTTNTSTDDNTFAWDELPGIVALYLRAHVAQDYATAVTHLAEDVIVLDDGHVLPADDWKPGTYTKFDFQKDL